MNRNFGLDQTTFQTKNDEYEKLASLFDQKERLRAPRFPLLSTLSLIKKAKKLGVPTTGLSQAIGQGQFKHPRGLEFGGYGYEPQVQFFIDRFKEVAKDYTRILHFDLHTGLGKKNRLHLLTGATAESRNEELLRELILADEDRSIYEFTEADEEGFYRTVGDINTLMPVLTPKARVLSLTMEFATLGAGILAKLDTLERLWLENQGANCGYTDARSERSIRRKFSELFAPTALPWRENTVRLGREMLTRVLQRAGALP